MQNNIDTDEHEHNCYTCKYGKRLWFDDDSATYRCDELFVHRLEYLIESDKHKECDYWKSPEEEE